MNRRWSLTAPRGYVRTHDEVSRYLPSVVKEEHTETAAEKRILALRHCAVAGQALFLLFRVAFCEVAAN